MYHIYITAITAQLGSCAADEAAKVEEKNYYSLSLTIVGGGGGVRRGRNGAETRGGGASRRPVPRIFYAFGHVL